MIKTNAGHVMVPTSNGMIPEYSYARAQGYTGTEDEYVQDMAKMPVELNSLIKVVTFSKSNVTQSAGDARHDLSGVVPSGYKVLMFGPVRTNGFVGNGFVAWVSNNIARVWLHVYSDISDGTISADVLCIKSNGE